MQKLDYLQQKNLNPADELRETLNALEMVLPRLKSLNPDEALALLQDMDGADALFAQLESEDVDLLSERGRFDSLQLKLKKRVGLLLKAIGGPTGLGSHRPSPSPPKERWWWYIHEDVAAQKKQAVRQFIIVAAGVALVLLALYVAFQTVWAPSPEAVARVNAENGAFAAFQEKDYKGALAEVNRGLEVVQNDSVLLILAGVFQEFLGEQAVANQSFENAFIQLDNPELFYLRRGQLYLNTDQFEKSENDARLAMEVSESSAGAWLLLGQALEFQNNRFDAITAYERASELALEQDKNELMVMARMSLARILASPGNNPADMVAPLEGEKQ